MLHADLDIEFTWDDVTDVVSEEDRITLVPESPEAHPASIFRKFLKGREANA